MWWGISVLHIPGPKPSSGATTLLPGSRAIDLEGWAATMLDRKEDWRAFLEGYHEVRPLSERDIAAAPHLHLAQDVWGIQVDLERMVIRQGDAAATRFLTERCDELASRARVLGLAAG